VAITAAHDLENPCAGPRQSGLHLAALIPCISDDALDEREGPSGLPQQGLSPVPVLHAGGMNGDRQEQAQRIGQDVALAACDLLARIIAGRVERSPPLRAPFVL